MFLVLFVVYTGYNLYTSITKSSDQNIFSIDYEMIANKFRVGQDNVCFSDGKPIFYKEGTKTGYLPDTEHCEHIYRLGSQELVYACEYEEKPKIVFRRENSSSFADTALSLNEFCTLIHFTPYLFDDIDFIINRNTKVKVLM